MLLIQIGPHLLIIFTGEFGLLLLPKDMAAFDMLLDDACEKC